MLFVAIDALYYASTTYKPHTLLDVATLTGYVLSSLLPNLSETIITEPWISLWEKCIQACSRFVSASVEPITRMTLLLRLTDLGQSLARTPCSRRGGT